MIKTKIQLSEILFHTLPALLLSLCALFPGNGAAEIRVTKVAADGHDVPLSVSTDAAKSGNSGPVRLASPTQAVRFHFQKDARAGEKPLRLCYKLEGADAEWRDIPSGMVVWVRLLDKAGNNVAGDSLILRGSSPGWNGRPEDAPLSPLHMSVTTPPLADRFRIYFISHGGSPSLGQLVADDVRAQVIHSDGKTGTIMRVDCETGQQLDKPHGIPANWQRDGERPELAQLITRTSPFQHPALLLNDDEPDKFGVWCSRDFRVPLEPGDRLTMTCKLAYSIGSGETQGVARYEKLKPGAYWFRVAAFQVNGLHAGEEVSLPIIVVPPLYRRAEFWLALVLAASAFTVLTFRKLIKLRMQRRLAQAEQARLIEAERTRIARDIHDDLGATLSQVAMLSEMARVEADDPKIVRGLLGDIFSSTHSATRALDEIVWAIKPENDTLESLIRYLCQFAERYLKLAGLNFRLDAPENMPPYSLTSAQRHNLFLAAKEALHNVVKHACATEVWMRVKIHADVLHLSIEDNGTGRVPGPEEPPSRGSANMKNRLEQIGGSCTRKGIPGQGTVVEFQFILNPGHE